MRSTAREETTAKQGDGRNHSTESGTMSLIAREETTAEQEDDSNHSTESGRNNQEEPTTKQVNSDYVTSSDVIPFTKLYNRTGSTPWSEVSRSRETTTPKHCSLSSNTTTSANGTTRKLYEKDKNNTKENSKSEASPTADESNSQTPAVVMVIIGIVILITIVVLVVVMFRRKICEKDNLSHPIAMSQIDNLKDEADIYANETEGNSPQDNEDQDVYSQVKERKLGWKEGQSDRVATNKTKAATEAHTAEPDVYAVVNKSSKTTASSSASKIHRVGGKVLANNDEYFPEQLYALASDDMADIYANEPAMQSLTTQSMTGAVSKTPSSQDDEGQTVIENDLYGH